MGTCSVTREHQVASGHNAITGVLADDIDHIRGDRVMAQSYIAPLRELASKRKSVGYDLILRRLNLQASFVMLRMFMTCRGNER